MAGAVSRPHLASAKKLQTSDIAFEDFHAYMPTHQYLYVPTRELWSAASVDSRLPKRDGVKASIWIDQHRHIEQMTWCPGKPMIIPDTLVSQGGWIPHLGATTYNLYRPPLVHAGPVADVSPWLDHLRRIYPDDVEHILNWCAQRVQHPDIKINHALVLGGNQGIGKDTILEPVKQAVGPWNVEEISPQHLMGRFNGFTKCTILRVNEARDLGDLDRFAFYEHTKKYAAAPPDVLRVDEKNLREYSVFNVCGLLITTNLKNGLHLDPDDRRHYVAWSDSHRDDFEKPYFEGIWRWFAEGGIAAVVAWLHARDLSAFDPKRPPTRTEAWRDIVDLSSAPEDAELADVLDQLGRPPALTLQMIADKADKPFSTWVLEPKSRRVIPHRLKTLGYTPFRCTWNNDGFWVVNRKRQIIYARIELSQAERQAAAQNISQSDSAIFT
jgi:hypothetical protein